MTRFTRHQTLALGLAGTDPLFLPAIAQAQSVSGNVRNNVSGFQMHDWRDHFDSLGKGVILADTVSRAMHCWGAN